MLLNKREIITDESNFKVFSTSLFNVIQFSLAITLLILAIIYLFPERNHYITDEIFYYSAKILEHDYYSELEWEE